MKLTDLTQLLSETRLPEVEWASLRYVREVEVMRTARDEKPEDNSSDTSEGVMVEILARGQVGYAATPRIDRAGIREAAERARAQAVSVAESGVFPFKKEHRPVAQGSYASQATRPPSKVKAAEISDLLIRMTRALKVSPKVVKAYASVWTAETKMLYASSSGSAWEQDFSSISTHSEATAQEGSLVQQRSDSGGSRCMQAGLEFLDTPDLMERMKILGEQSVELLSSMECPTETLSLVLMPDQMMMQIHESIGHPLEIDRIIGDERNYAGWSFVKPQDFGRLQYGSPLMNVSFDPTVTGELASYAFDDSGVPAKREMIIDGGLLRRGLGSVESQLRSKLPGVANSRSSSWNRPPIDRMANLNLEAGTTSFSEMIRSIERGVIMDSNRSWSIDDFRNKFQFGCEYGKMIENGKVTKTVRNPNYRGITVPFWNNLKHVGDRSTMGTFGTFQCGKGEPNQIIRVGHRSPVCHFEKTEVFGGGK